MDAHTILAHAIATTRELLAQLNADLTDVKSAATATADNFTRSYFELRAEQITDQIERAESQLDQLEHQLPN